MKNKIDEMLSTYGLNVESSILPLLGDIMDENEIRECCWQVLHTYSDLKKEDWIIGIEGLAIKLKFQISSVIKT